MNEPKIISYTKPLSLADRAHLVPVLLADFEYTLAVRSLAYRHGSVEGAFEIPKEVGRMRAYDHNSDEVKLEKCSQVLD